MTIEEARGIITDYYLAESHSEDDKFLFVEAHHFLINIFHDPNDMHNLAFHYAEERNFELYQKYLEMAASYGFLPAFEGLGYIWYYGQTGTIDYEKAFYYFSEGAKTRDDYLRIGCEYKIADMYKNGYYVQKDKSKYKEIIERLFDEISHPKDLVTIIPQEFISVPGVYFRLAEIRAEEGKAHEAIHLLEEARIQLAEDLRRNPSWWGNIEEIEVVVLLMYEISIDWSNRWDLYDLFWLSKSECELSFVYNSCRFTVECIEEDGRIIFKFNNKLFSDIYRFFERAKIGGRPITAIYSELIEYEVSFAGGHNI